MSHYNGFNYEEFYEFIIDFFEGDQTPEGKAATRELFNWWNRYVPNSNLPLLSLRPPRCVFPQSAATRAASSTSAGRLSLAILRRQRQARSSR
jgi:hypothetical protein